MLQNSSNQPEPVKAVPAETPIHRWAMLLALPAWVLGGFLVAQVIVIGIIDSLDVAGALKGWISQATLNTLFSILIYAITLAIVIGLPWLIHHYKTSRSDVGLVRLPSWVDIWLAPTGLVIYFIFSAILILIATHLFPSFNVDQAQDIGFSGLSQKYEYILAFLTLVVVAPVAEEVLFRGYLYGKLRRHVPIWAAILATSILFGAIHGAWNVAIDTFALSVVLCILREMTGNVWASILLHMMKNGIAFYILFINPTIFTTLGG
jgi:membrane protease YdiL (CAAX protease family)